MNTTLENAAAEYLEAVGDAFADLPDDELADIVDDVAEHLEQVTAEFGDDASRAALEQRLGTPEQYAAELRAAAGYPETARRTARGSWKLRLLRFHVTWVIRLSVAAAAVGLGISLADEYWYPEWQFGAVVAIAIAGGIWLAVNGPSREPSDVLRELPDVARLDRHVSAVLARPGARATAEFIASLRPAWWLLRAWVATQMLMFVFGTDPAFPLSRTPLALIVFVGAVTASVWWGRRVVSAPLRGWPRLWQLAGNTVLAVMTPLVVFMAGSASAYSPVYEEMGFDYYGFHHADGSPILNLFLYDQEGRFLEGVRIYDQDGRPVENLEVLEWDECIDHGGYYPGGQNSNVFPRPGVVYSESGFARCSDPADVSPFGPALPGTTPDKETEPTELEADVVEPRLEDDK